MAIVREMNQPAWLEWLGNRPKVIQELGAKYPPDRLYRLKTTGHRVTLHSYSEDGTVTVNVTGEYNCLAFERQVFGIKPADLEETELPGPDEVVGSLDIPFEVIKAFHDAGKGH